MKGTLAFDPQEYDYGPADSAVQTIFAEWTAIDWFEPVDDQDTSTLDLFLQHQRLAHAYHPDLFPTDLEVKHDTGGWAEFVAWCTRVRSNTSWDWKFTALKQLSKTHATAKGWSPEAHVPRMTTARPGDLLIRLIDATRRQVVIWNNFMPKLRALDEMPRDPLGDCARFYLGYAHGDVLDCIKWQLAEHGNDLGGNPFLPLLLCYGTGAYPFSLGRESVVLFRFERGDEDAS